MTIPYEEPGFEKKAFNCPFCNAYSNFYWGDVIIQHQDGRTPINYKSCRCSHCQQWTMWIREAIAYRDDSVVWEGKLVYPSILTSPIPHEDLPESCKSEYEEARNVLNFSPRASAALLRLCIQKLCVELGAKGDDINRSIGDLVKNGLDQRIQMALDVVRVSGNNAVHPGTMDLKDDRALVNKLFKLVNLIVEEMITKPKEIDSLYGSLPEGARKAIERRDT